MAVAANIALDISLNVEAQAKDIEIAVSRRRKYMSMKVEKSTSPLPEYEGPYSAVSQLYYGRTLPTNGKRMVADMEILPIPINEVSNPSGGVTVTIGNA